MANNNAAETATQGGATALTEGTTVKGNIKGFRPIAGYGSVVINVNGENESILVGTLHEVGGITGLMALKGCSIEATFRGTKEVNGKAYKQFNLEVINFA